MPRKGSGKKGKRSGRPRDKRGRTGGRTDDRRGGRGKGRSRKASKRKNDDRRTLLPKGERRPREKPVDDADASPENLAALMEEAGFSMTPKQRDLFWEFHCRLMERNREINLTRIHRFRDVVLKHYVDSAMVLRLLDGKLPSPLLDIGAGPGFPGIPLAILEPRTEIVLAEGRAARVQFLEEMVELLDLSGARVEGRQIHPSHTDPVNGAVTRALEAIPATLDRVRGCLQQGGRAIFMKGPNCEEEIAAVAEQYADDWRVVADHAYRLPVLGHARRLLVYERLSAPENPTEK